VGKLVARLTASEVLDINRLDRDGPNLNQLRHKATQCTDCQSDQMRILNISNRDFREQSGNR
jgi:hypothetical protein